MLFHRQSTRLRTGILAFATALTILATIPGSAVMAQPDPVIETCSSQGCANVVTLLQPCGGGATNSSLQHDSVYTPTAILGSCECNSQFFNALSSCLACVSSQGQNFPVIQNQQDWEANCQTYGFNFTDAPINFTQPIGGGGDSGASHGISKGAIAGIVIAVLLLLGGAGAWYFFRGRKRRTKGGIFERPYIPAGSGTGAGYAPTTAGFNTNAHYHNAEYPGQDDYAPQGLHQDSYYDYNDDSQQQLHHYGSEQNGSGHEDDMMMSNLQHSNFIPPPVPMSPSAVAAVANPRPSDQFPQSLRSRPAGWTSPELTSDLLSSDHLMHNDKAVYEDDDEVMEPPRSRDRFTHDRDSYSARSLTPPRANMQSYRDDFTRPSFDRNASPRSSTDRIRNQTRSPRGETDDEDDQLRTSPLSQQESPENARRRRAAELFSAEGTRR
ncbi:hypothetical protein BGZ83_003430 [Gryganskiella cystojenkinii]|nr:hypothetical protein BGZ83_003430 [Gryganskiella cystojenkinii]